MFGKCKVCEEKDLRILDLKDEITNLRKLIFSPTESNKVSPQELEADKIMSGAVDEVIESEDDEQIKKEIERTNEILSERDRLLSGTY